MRLRQSISNWFDPRRTATWNKHAPATARPTERVNVATSPSENYLLDEIAAALGLRGRSAALRFLAQRGYHHLTSTRQLKDYGDQFDPDNPRLPNLD